MFPLHQSNELVFQICSHPPQQHKIPDQDLIVGHASLDCSSFNTTLKKGQRRKLCDSLDHNYGNFNEKKKLKMRHREVERQRRQEMTTLFASLRSSLPLEFIKGKRSKSDHINEAGNYIKHLQKKIKELSSVRDKLKKHSNTTDHGSGSSNSTSPPSFMKVNPRRDGVEILITSSFEEERMPLSRVLEVLIEGGLTVVSCVSAKVNERFLHTIQSEISDSTEPDLSELQKKLTEAIPSLRCTSP
ncbi:hypothetical protein I3843_03G093800 [Carya illinoinensis]|uniref:BHLH domain-containing protein n=1 Tax=Carya illinoinensis TaxID=32201 RepID=A0A8T1R2L7_CARIL|nr:transcription factor bHLH120-like [Carya illinoinensis]KAG6660341.1 hypothetical protein CIPAW_03G099000 [Carya illinoinensis]KAG6721076.1 hypothetical protein I3842_03G094200 [Carya illinoinensis]KAG7986685.1 hypothetical protein I3843_03G093800 [Carya illinoinensis]